MNKKPTLYIDMDNVVFDTISTIKRMYDEEYRYYSAYEYVPVQKIKSYEFSELKLLTKERLNEYFCSGRFFDCVTCLDDAERIIAQLNRLGGFPVTFISIGTPENIKGKSEWVSTFNRLWHTNADFYGVYDINKSNIPLIGGVLIDDELKNLQNNSANHSICFGDYLWNKEWKGERVLDWITLRKMLNEGRYDIRETTVTT